MSAQGDGSRDERLAKNEALFRDLNERIERAAGSGNPSTDKFGFVCECANDTCFDLIHLSIYEYERLRGNPLRFMVVPGHEMPEIEEIVEENEGYLFIKKTGTGATVASDSDPRRLT